MENCGGGGQRLPPDGDEFPTEYQEFGKAAAENGNDAALIKAVDAISPEDQQYRFIGANNSATASMTMTMTMTGERSATSATFPRDKHENTFPEKERLKLVAIESNVISTRSRSIVLPENRVSLVPPACILDTCQDLKGKLTSSPSKGTVTSVENLYISEDIVKKTVPPMNYSSYSDSHSNGNLEISEKKIEITDYQKDTSIGQPLHREKDSFNDTPPPLPLTGPPKMEASAKNAPALEQSSRKFSLNGELRRQDDKSERSVRDKIAMFSSQSNLDAPVFPSTITVASNTASPKRLSKYKSSEDVCASDDKTSPSGQREKALFFAERTQSSFDLTDSSRCLPTDSSKYTQVRSTVGSQVSSPYVKSSLPSIHTPNTKTLPLPVLSQKPSTTLISSSPSSPIKTYPWSTQSDSSPENANTLSPNGLAGLKTIQGSSSLARATSFSGSTPHGASTSSELSSPVASQVSRTNSLASTFRRPAEDMRKTSLNQLIEQRRRSISKLRGLVIPEKEAIPIDQPIVDLPEIKSRDFILTHQLPKSNLQDKWGSQSSLASNASATSSTTKVTTSFKMPAPQINSKYSPAFKRKSLTVYGTSASPSTVNGSNKPKDSPTSSVNAGLVTAVTTAKTTASVIGTSVTSTSPSPTSTSTTLSSTPQTFSTEAPKSLESICSPTRSDYSFDFVSASNSPEGLRSKGRMVQRKTRMDYDDSDNDSAVSSSQSSISRGFSPPMSPVPSERSTISSERSYLSTEMNYPRRCLVVDSPGRTNSTMGLAPKPSLNGKMYLTERSPLCSSSTSSSTSSTSSASSTSSSTNSRSPQSAEANLRNSQIPQRQPVRRSNSTDTNCSTSSTLTSGSQASGESLSRRVLKPQSVEAINRKNILASARCRSGRELNGSPLIQRKLVEDETRYMVAESDVTLSNRNDYESASVGTTQQNIKVAYIEVTDPFGDDELFHKASEDDCEPKLPPKRSIPQPAARPPKSEMLEASNDLRMWVRAEAKALETKSKLDHRNRQDSTEIDSPPILSPRGRNAEGRGTLRQESRKETKLTETHRTSTSKSSDDHNDDLLTILTTKSRSRSAIHVDDGSFGRAKSQMSLEEILCAKAGPKLTRTHSVEESAKESEKNGMENKYWTVMTESRCEEKTFVSKIPTYGRPERRMAESAEDSQSELAERTKCAMSKIPTASRTLTRRSASVTDIKKALDKTEPTNSMVNERNTTSSPPNHSRFPSLDSSVDNAVEENGITSLTRSHMPHPLDRCMDPRMDTNNLSANPDVERYCGEQFGSISSLASSTSLISQQELAQLVEEANLEEIRSAQEVIVVLLHKEKPTGSVGITLAGGADCEVKEITVHRVLAHSVADKDGRVQRGDRILSINGRSTRGLTHRESLAVLKQPRSEVVLVVSRARPEEGCKLRSRTTSVETIIEGFESNGVPEDIAWGPASVIAVYKDGAGLGFSLEGGRDSPLGDRPLVIKKIFTGGAAEKTGALKAGDQLLEVNGNDVTRMSRIEAWSFMKKLHDGEVNLLVRHPATKSS